MTISTVLLLFVLAAIALSTYVVFYEYPRAALDNVRGKLFSRRAELFELARSGALSFDSDGYRAARSSINAMIRYAHHISLIQLLLSRLFQTEESRRFQDYVRAEFDAAQQSLEPEVRSEVKGILDRSTVHLLQLLITRSVILTCVFGVFVLIHEIFKLAAKVAAIPLVPPRTPVEQTLDDILVRRPEVTPALRAEAVKFLGASKAELACEAA